MTRRSSSLLVGACAATVVAGAWFALCCSASTLPAVSDVSLSLAFRPWTRNIVPSVVVWVVVFAVVAGLVYIRPSLRQGR